MGMWVRSRDKTMLMEVNNFSIQRRLSSNYGYAIYSKVGSALIELGNYALEARALEILDEIAIHIYNSSKGKIKIDEENCNNNIFEMPIW